MDLTSRVLRELDSKANMDGYVPVQFSYCEECGDELEPYGIVIIGVNSEELSSHQNILDVEYQTIKHPQQNIVSEIRRKYDKVYHWSGSFRCPNDECNVSGYNFYERRKNTYPPNVYIKNKDNVSNWSEKEKIDDLFF